MGRRPGGEAEIRARVAAAPGLSAAEAHALAGLLDAECHLAVASNNGDGWCCTCSVNLRDDDRQVLVDYRAKLGLGHLTSVAAKGRSRPQVRWTIGSKLECRLVVELLDSHPLYRPPAHPLAMDDGGDAARDSYLAVLRDWAVSAHGRLTCTAYEATRRIHPEWPQRETLTREFGTWYDALRSAGLAHRAARRPSARQLRVQLDRLHGRQGLRYRAAFLRRLRGLLELGVVQAGR